MGSAVNITSTGWQAELKFLTCLRFPKAELQNWSVNVFRHIRRYHRLCRNPIDITLENKAQAGAITRFENIEPPIRLSMLPFLASSTITEGNTNSITINGGLDLKYGLNESFTLDMTLVPDLEMFRQSVPTYLLLKFNTRRDFLLKALSIWWMFLRRPMICYCN